MLRRLLTAVLAVAAIWTATGECMAQAGGAATKPATPAPAAPKSPAPSPASPALVLDTYGAWRNFHVMSPPVIQFDDGLKPVLTPIEWLNRPTAPAPADWRKNEFDDATWQKGSARAFARTPYLERLCLRARFEVTDPAAVKDLRLTLAYYGGAIVTLNGQELIRGHVAKEGAASLAEGYPPEAFLTDDGKITPAAEWQMARLKKQLALRERSLTDIEIPAKSLRKGVNVVAVEVVRAPYHKVVDEKKIDPNKSRDTAGQGCPYDLSWSLCELRSIKLAAAGEEGLVPNAARPKEMQIWNGDFVTPDYGSDLGDRCEPLRPVTVLAPRDGWGHGKVVVGSPRKMDGLKASCGDLKGGDGVIPASAARIRYGWSWGGGSIESYGDAVRYGAPFLDALLDALPEANLPGQFGTVVPIWVTFQVPAGAKPGVYKGELTITATNEKPATVPVHLEVADWTAPDAKDYRAWIELIQSPDTLALEYGEPLWSPRHMELIGQSLRYIGQIGSRMAYVPLICYTNSGNAESMVRWIKKDGGGYEYDFTAMDRYLDQVEKNMGTPKFTVFQTWEIYLATPKEAAPVQVKGNEGSWEWTESSAVKARQEWKGKGPAVTVLDRATGKTEAVTLPRFDDPAAGGLWTPLFVAIRERMQKRGWEKSMALGMAADIYPTKEEVVTLEAVSAHLPWVRHTHGGNSVGGKMQGIGQIDYTAYVWNVEFAPDPSKGRLYGWKQADLFAQFRRFTAINYFAPASALHFEELNITGKQRGLGRIGADFWPVLKDKQGRRRSSVGDRYIQSYWHSLNLSSHLLVPGPAGPVASTRYEQFREGMQECEARIAIESVLTDETLKAKIAPDLAKRCQDTLDERLRTLWRAGSPMLLTGRDYASQKLNGDTYGGAAGQFWFAGSGWQERTRQLYTLAGEVARSVAGK